MVPFYLLTAFSTSIHGGNPAAVVFLDLGLPTDMLAGIARNLNQPMTTFLSSAPLKSTSDKVIDFNVRWFTPSLEVGLCGHGTLAAAKAVFGRSDLVTDSIEAVRLHTPAHGVVIARKVGGGFIEIQLPAGSQEEVSPDEKAKLSKMLTNAFGKEVTINHIGNGGKDFKHYLMVELDEQENLGACRVNADALRDSGFLVNIITTASSGGDDVFISRMFSPGHVPGDEDHVCGTAHCIMAPYWYQKKGIPRGREIKAKQVSQRGGELKIVWEADADVVRLMGEVVLLAKGELHLP